MKKHVTTFSDEETKFLEPPAEEKELDFDDEDYAEPPDPYDDPDFDPGPRDNCRYY